MEGGSGSLGLVGHQSHLGRMASTLLLLHHALTSAAPPPSHRNASLLQPLESPHTARHGVTERGQVSIWTNGGVICVSILDRKYLCNCDLLSARTPVISHSNPSTGRPDSWAGIVLHCKYIDKLSQLPGVNSTGAARTCSCTLM